MNKLKFKQIGILIGVTLLFAIVMQAWRLVSQFEVIQDRLVADVQQSLDNAVENYYAELAKSDVIALTDNFVRNSGTLQRVDSSSTQIQQDSMFVFLGRENEDSLTAKDADFFARVGRSTLLKQHLFKADSVQKGTVKELKISNQTDSLQFIDVDKINQIRVFRGKEAADSINNLEIFTSKIIISLIRDTLDFAKMDSLLVSELDRNGINVNYKLNFTGKKSLDKDTVKLAKEENFPFQIVSRSTFLPPGKILEMYFENTALTILKRGLVELLTSLAFLAIIAFALYYLYQTIKNQKEIAEIKQDLIANITHEFKTPIATTLSAIEGIQQFNPENDLQKTDRYLGISKTQMLKLNQMVEKLLETATLDSDQLAMKKEQIEPEPLLRQLVQKFQTLAPEKDIELVMPARSKTIFADPFHFENVLSNLLDNAIKYGGDQIRIYLDQNGMHKIRIHDNGGNIPQEQKERVFEQFYRIPKGDVHDVKGFGIGLYYVKKILEKHEGKIELGTGKNSTTFITYWP
ncbi:MAG: HAMP domain-containing histidine kinase [Algoriphagus sp.]|jgi:two-component system phosphate regulon sensor histidine kinase PhoR|nr:HAMP domain-containing histidine kinase [Algoriphagus sp.]